jgi:hypothetical protein
MWHMDSCEQHHSTAGMEGGDISVICGVAGRLQAHMSFMCAQAAILPEQDHLMTAAARVKELQGQMPWMCSKQEQHKYCNPIASLPQIWEWLLLSFSLARKKHTLIE